MKTDNAVREKTYNFALRIVKMYRYIVEEKKEYVISKQLLRCGTSIGANIEEGCSAQSRKDFINKLSIAQKESYETRYWLKLLRDSEIIETIYIKSMLKDCEEIIKLISKILVTTKKNDKI
ncbi:four helix bundle protein [Dethiothermospora halolimnae]|uniref:four helix bundle protein n=1 Tax=Dethiothermospora halolimnae TaxID=3114390 RepID=UPI003CCBA45B